MRLNANSPRKVLLNFANERFRESQRLNSQTGRELGGFDEAVSYSPDDLPWDFRRRHSHILRHQIGAGYWLWKPYFVLQTLEELSEGDYLFYCDAGSYFVHSIEPLIEIARATGQDVLTFGLPYPEKQWTKRDAFLLLEVDTPRFTDTRQRLSGFILWRKSETSLELARDWLKYAQDERALTDMPNQLGWPNYKQFTGHRHDQSILSLLAKLRNLPAYRDPSQFGNEYAHEFPNSPYPQLIELTRARCHLRVWQKFLRETRRFTGAAS